ncbi:MAG: tetratricopeptide repeat protein [Deltaproteobacteria bacterium]|nr:tetratricopeptide repeat protein [Deltaproteobacteria bacterium]
MHRRWFSILALLLAACMSPEDRAAEHITRGEQELADDNVEAALLEFQSALKLRPGDATLYSQIGDILYEDRQAYQEALPYYQEARRIDPDFIHAKMREARLVAFRNPERARKLINSELLYRRTVDPPVLLADAHLALIEGKYDQALISAREAVRIDDTSPPGWAQLGTVYIAKINRRKLRGEDPGELLYGLALGAFDKVEELKGGAYPRARLETARVHWFNGAHKRARLHFIDAVNLAREQGKASETKFAISTTIDYAQRVGDDDLIRRMLREQVTLSPADYAAWAALGRAYDSFPGHTGEEVHLELLERDPGEARAHVLYSAWLVHQGREADAEAHLETARGEGIDDPLLGEALVRLALRRGDLASARAAWVEMAEEDETSPVTQLAAARIAMAEQRLSDAVELLTALSRARPHYETERLLALTHHQRKDLAAARHHIDRAMELAPPPKTAALRLRASIDIDSHDWRRAIQAYEELLQSGLTLAPSERADHALALYRSERADEGSEILDELAEAQPPAPHAALIFWKLEGERQAERAYRLLSRAHSAAPIQPELLALLTDIDLAAGHPGTSHARLTRLVDERLASPYVLLLRAEVLATLGAYPEAEADVLRALEANPALPGTIDLLHELYTAQGKLEEARRSFEQADNAGVLHAGARQLLARFYQEDGETQRALEMLERVVQEAPDLWTARADLAYLLAEDEATIATALEMASSALADSTGATYARNAAGWVDLRAGRAASALQHFETAIEAEGVRVPPTLHYHRGLALRALARETDAAAAFEQALAAGEFPEAEDARQQLEATRHAGTDAGSAS